MRESHANVIECGSCSRAAGTINQRAAPASASDWPILFASTSAAGNGSKGVPANQKQVGCVSLITGHTWLSFFSSGNIQWLAVLPPCMCLRSIFAFLSGQVSPLFHLSALCLTYFISSCFMFFSFCMMLFSAFSSSPHSSCMLLSACYVLSAELKQLPIPRYKKVRHPVVGTPTATPSPFTPPQPSDPLNSTNRLWLILPWPSHLCPFTTFEIRC